MTKEVIIKELSQRHINFVNYILSLSYKEFMFSFQDNWTAGQQMDHIYRATVFLPLAFQMPEFIIGFIFGKPKNAPMGYDELVQQYLLQLEKGARAPHLFKPAKIPYSYRIDLADKTVKNISKINIAIDAIPEKHLDQLMLPHPLLGKITYREMLYFTMYHVNHHSAIAKRYVSEM